MAKVKIESRLRVAFQLYFESGKQEVLPPRGNKVVDTSEVSASIKRAVGQGKLRLTDVSQERNTSKTENLKPQVTSLKSTKSTVSKPSARGE